MTSEDREQRRRISVRAFELYLSRGEIDGHDIEDWLQAEAEVSGDQRPSGSPDPEIDLPDDVDERREEETPGPV